MARAIHPETILANITCSTCGTKYQCIGAYYDKKFSIEQCSNCHMAFTGERVDSATSSAIEKFNDKFGAFKYVKKSK